MRLGFTSSRHGITEAQARRFVDHVWGITEYIDVFRYGDCKGGDERGLRLMVEMHLGREYHSHPATMNPAWDARWRANTASRYPELDIIEHPALPPLDRNRVIVDGVDSMIGCPGNSNPRGPGGTWYTIRYAWDKGVPIVVIGPDGKLIERDA